MAGEEALQSKSGRGSCPKLDSEQWSTRQSAPGRQFHDFQQVLDRTHFHWDLKKNTTDGFSAEVDRRSFDEFIFTHVEADPLQGRRTLHDIRQSDQHYFCLLYFGQGSSLLGQGPNESELHTGSISLWDSTRPAFFNATKRLQQYSLLIPHDLGTSCLPGIEDLCGLEVSGQSGMGAILLAHLKQLHASIDDVDARDRTAIMRATVELAAAAFRPEEQNSQGTTFRRALLARVQEYINTNLADPRLGPQTVADAFQFSPRYLHRLFSEFDLTVSDWIKRRRLARCRYDLEDARFDGYSITQIALKNGFGDSSHFSRCFRAEFDINPREHRYQAKLLRSH